MSYPLEEKVASDIAAIRDDRLSRAVSAKFQEARLRLAANDSSKAAYVVIAGNVGTGKSTLLQRIAGVIPEAEVLIERPEPSLVDYYRDPLTYAFQTQLAFMLQYLACAGKAQSSAKPVVFQERSVHDGAEVFGRMRAERGWIDPTQGRTIQQVEAQADTIRRPDLFILLDAEPDVLLSRVRSRGAGGDEHIGLSYLTDLRARYLHWFTSLRSPKLRLQSSLATDDLMAVVIDRVIHSLFIRDESPR